MVAESLNIQDKNTVILMTVNGNYVVFACRVVNVSIFT